MISFWRWRCNYVITKGCERDKGGDSWKKESIFIDPEANCALDTIVGSSMRKSKHCTSTKSIVLAGSPSIISEAIAYLWWCRLWGDYSQGTMAWVYSFSIKNSFSNNLAVFITFITNSDLKFIHIKRLVLALYDIEYVVSFTLNRWAFSLHLEIWFITITKVNFIGTDWLNSVQWLTNYILYEKSG